MENGNEENDCKEEFCLKKDNENKEENEIFENVKNIAFVNNLEYSSNIENNEKNQETAKTYEGYQKEIKNLKIIVDKREIKSLVVKYLSEKCKIEERLLEIGDYLISEDVCCERKTTADFLRSIVDGRLFSQLRDIKNSYASPILIIEGDSLFEDTSIRPEAIRGALASIAIDIKIPILWSKSPRETAEFLVAIAKREQSEKKKEIKLRFEKKPKELKYLQEYLVAGLPGVDRERAKRLLEHFKCPEFVFTASERELMRVKGIGRHLAKMIREVLSREYEKDSDIKARKNKSLKDVL